jgi:hypothetical protein
MRRVAFRPHESKQDCARRLSVLRGPGSHQALQHGMVCPIFGNDFHGVDPLQVKREEPTINEFAIVSLLVRRPFANVVLAGRSTWQP